MVAPLTFHQRFYAITTSFFRTFAVTFLSFAVGIIGATNTSVAISLSIAAFAASLAAAGRTLQVTFLPFLSFKGLLGDFYGGIADAFVRAALANFIAAATGWFSAPNWGNWHAAWFAILQGAAVAGFRALQGAVSPGESPAPNQGDGGDRV